MKRSGCRPFERQDTTEAALFPKPRLLPAFFQKKTRSPLEFLNSPDILAAPSNRKEV
jgi:hypothetical protein